MSWQIHPLIATVVVYSVVVGVAAILVDRQTSLSAERAGISRRVEPVIATAVLYAIVVGVAAVVVAFRAAPATAPVVPPSGNAASLVAARPLAPNHRLGPGDLRFAADPTSGLSGRYLLGNGVPEGAAVEPARFAALPDLWPAEGRLLLSLSLPKALAEAGVNAGSEVRICGTGHAQPVRARVHALRCEAAAVCLAVLDLPQAVARELATALVPPLRATICPS